MRFRSTMRRLALLWVSPLLLAACGNGEEAQSPASPSPPPVEGDVVLPEPLAACLTEGGYPAEVGESGPFGVEGTPETTRVVFRVEFDPENPDITTEVDLEVFASEEDAEPYTTEEELIRNVYLDPYTAQILQQPVAERANEVVTNCIEHGRPSA